MNVDRSPSRVGLGLTAVPALLTALLTGIASGGVAVLGLPLAVGGVHRSSRRLLGTGVVLLFFGVVAASTAELPTGVVVLAMIGTVLTWDVGDHAIGIAAQLRERGRTERVEVVHAAASTLVATFFGLGGYIVFGLSAGGQPELALTLLLVGAVLVLAALR